MDISEDEIRFLQRLSGDGRLRAGDRRRLVGCAETIAELRKRLEWQPMEAAPTGRYVLAKNDLNGDVFLARRYNTGNWFPADVPCVSLHITSWKEVE